MAINLDERIQNRKSFIIADKSYSLVMNDAFSKNVATVDLSISKVQKEIDDVDKETADDMSLEEQKAFIFGKFDEAAKIARDFFDEVLGDGEGQRIYHYYVEDSQALAYIIGQLNKESSNIAKKNRQQHRQKYTNNKRR